MKKLLALSLSAISLAACGSSKPETSDVKAFLEFKFQGCKNIHATNIKKTNGYPHPEVAGIHVVEYTYTIALKNPSEFRSLKDIYEQEKKTLQSLGPTQEEIWKESNRALEEGRNSDFAQIQMQGRDIVKKREEFLQNAKVAGNIPLKVSRYYLEGCGDAIQDVVPIQRRHGYGGRVLDLGNPEADASAWFGIQNTDMTGKARLRKTDNGWRGL
ncbi:MAG: hypothetical protein ACN6OP_24975 [Pseudomonadales bacterium]